MLTPSLIKCAKIKIIFCDLVSVIIVTLEQFWCANLAALLFAGDMFKFAEF